MTIFIYFLLYQLFTIFRHGVSRSPHRRPRTSSNGTWRWTRSHYYLLIKKKLAATQYKEKKSSNGNKSTKKKKIRAIIKLRKLRKETKLAELKISFDRPKYREMSFFDPKTKQKTFAHFFLKGRGLKKTVRLPRPLTFL